MRRSVRGWVVALWSLGVVAGGGGMVACGGGGGDGSGSEDGQTGAETAGGGDAAGGADTGGPPPCLTGEPGEVLYTFAAGREIRGTPAVDGAGNVYFATMDFTIVSVDCRGEQRWSYAWDCGSSGGAPCSHAFSAPVAVRADGAIVNGDVLFALGSDGGDLWQSSALATAGDLDAPPALGSGGEVFVGSRSLGAGGSAGKLFGLEAGGALRGGFPIDLGGAVESGPLVSGAVVYVAHARRAGSSSQKYTLAVSAYGFDGSHVWTQTLADADGFPYGTAPPSSLAMDSAGRVLVVVSRLPSDQGATQTHLLRLAPGDGQVVAQTRLTAPDCTGSCAPIVRGSGAEEEVFVASSWQGLIDRSRPADNDSVLFIDPNFPGCRDCRAPSPAVGADGLLYVVGGASGAMEPGAPPLALYPLEGDGNGRGVTTAEYPFKGKDEADNVSTSVQIGPNGVAYVGTRAGVLVAIQTGAGGLDPAAPWPASRHDAANSGRAAP